MRALLLAILLGCSWSAVALANGRMPGANDLVFSTALPNRIVARATFGIVESEDSGGSWRWICEQAIDISGVIADPPLALMHDGTEVLLPPTGSALISRSAGCSWTREDQLLAGRRGVDLTIDPRDPKRLLVLTSTLRSIDSAGAGRYENLLLETRDDALSWQLLATLPSDFEAETVELSSSDEQRLYVSGTDVTDPRVGLLLRSEDGGQTFSATRHPLPAGTGSLWISAVHPTHADRLWLRVSARGDSLGLLPARLYASTDKGASMQMLAATNKGMFGFALSPDGERLAYGGPSDGLFVGAADGVGGFDKRSSLSIRCLRWLAPDTLYACASEPADPFSVGVSADEGASFRALFKLSDTCPAACASGTSFAASCETAWAPTQTLLSTSAGAPMCTLPWDAGLAELRPVDAGTVVSVRGMDASGPGALDASTPQPSTSSGGGCAVVESDARGVGALGLLLLLLLRLRGRRARES